MIQPSLARSVKQPQAQNHQLEQRRLEALAIAKKCEQVLREKFGVTKVILFGSITGQSPWHWDSDLDIAVTPLPDDAWLEAYGELEKIAPNWLKIDLVRLERVHPAVRARILQEKTMPDNPYLVLKEHLTDELAALERSTNALSVALERTKPMPDEYGIRALATYVNDFYRRCERMSERVAVSLDGGIPQGPNWHQTLLQQVTEPRENRPPLWSSSLLLKLDQYRKFRHVVHHKYGDELKPEPVLTLAELAPIVLDSVRQAVASFNEWLTKQADLT
ncbi:MAG: nucleotidyltransferase domain-containing protein [Symploca sp. SIO2E9]|nr:nucleotidyltransferase domain-containing protein [Symploca sp. SIO2E9]